MQARVIHRALAPLAMALVLIGSLARPAAAAESDWLLSPTREAPAFTDTAGTGYEDAIALVYETGLMNGRSAASFDPEAELMPEELVAVCGRLYHALTDGDLTLPAPAEGEAWYEPCYRDLAVCTDYRGEYDPEAGAYVGGSDGAETPEERYEVLMWNFRATKYPVLGHMLTKLLGLTLEAAEMGSDSMDDITAGFEANEVITRGEFAVILARLVDPGLRQGA